MRRLLAALALLGSVCGRSVPGVVELDEFTFEKVAASAHFDVLVKFDKEYAYGTSEDTFKAVVATLNAAETRSDFLVASLAIKENDESARSEIAAKYAVDAKNLPQLKLIKKNGDIVSYTGGLESEQQLANFIKFECGVWIGLEGTMEDFDALAAQFAAAAGLARSVVVSAARARAADYDDAELEDSARYYVKVMEKLLDRADYAATEAVRLKRILAGKVSAQKTAQFEARINILAAFGSPAAEL
ncbi:endoplasmic reticulum protein ERp29, C-terminal domain-containing protein [Pelagophyceae sp. CCMP2097]|nr:endoplasmic reticulum protein ERp29, C-terminal domain-containing protein [Pelagophyceae sp. CCMP2097]